ncbi:Aste57867_14787 [Aphanomyces stellatus]|uniref:Aste57867_14787 protein n=1 Tax=Aphanomyces stellatus TaxID=120398 RepID=A0A485L2I2_9STRA|nr:hypothetical protein As57867_014732 [Aphanomyces stellatus]VFT91605.1 Aste57867_14787 [Aphanomyces stellatus]
MWRRALPSALVFRRPMTSKTPIAGHPVSCLSSSMDLSMPPYPIQMSLGDFNLRPLVEDALAPVRARQWSHTLLALETYKSIHGNLLVPRTFTVPQDDDDAGQWPVACRGRRLGTAVSELRLAKATMLPARVRALDALGFVWRANQVQWDTLLLALDTFKTLHGGNLRVPTRFIVPDQDAAWPRVTWRVRLGNAVSNLRRDGDFMDRARRAALDARGFEWIVREAGCGPTAPRVFSLATQRLYVDAARHIWTHQGHTAFTTFPRAEFHVPSDDANHWPRHLRGRILRVSEFRHAYRHDSRTLDSSVVAALNAMRFVWDAHDHDWQLTVHALTLYKGHCGSLLVPQLYRIPQEDDDDDEWPIYLRGRQLGLTVSNLRQKGPARIAPARVKTLNAMGFEWHAKAATKMAQWTCYVEALHMYKHVHGHVAVPQAFVVPDNDWPSHLVGLKLGSIVNSLRSGHTSVSESEKQELDSLGFLWRVKKA